MSHFSVAVFTDGRKTIEELLEPYNENLVVPTYIRQTKLDAIKEVREEIAEYAINGPYAQWLSNKDEYEKGCKNESHLRYLREEFPKKLYWTDEDCYRDAIKYCEEDELDANGNILSTYNPRSKWDWYSIGGRWAGMLPAVTGTHGEGSAFARNPQKEGFYDSAKVKDISFPVDFETFAVVTPDGEWHEKGKMGWWGIVADEKEGWKESYKEAFLDKADPSWTLTIIDCHI
ncbi:hypothetical protein C3B58_15395 [Lactonifactor longoviformis]|nr:hypothetical protein C3B58_15395 [Lactonifactor longoviformis]